MSDKGDTKQQQSKKKKSEKAELSPEDEQLRDDIAMCVDRVVGQDAELQKTALQRIVTEIRTSTASMTSVPKPLKFLKPHIARLEEYFRTSMPAGDNKKLLADVLSVLVMAMEDNRKHESLMYKLQGNMNDLESWGHDFVRNLAGEVAVEHNKRVEALEAAEEEGEMVDSAKQVQEDDLLQLVKTIVPFHMKHNAEPDACDLLMELGRTEDIVNEVDYTVYSKHQRVYLYLTACAKYYPEPENSRLRRTALQVQRRAKQWVSALVLALGLNDMETAKAIFLECGTPAMRRQLAFVLARHGAIGAAEIAESAETIGCDEDEVEMLKQIASNQKLAEFFGTSTQELNLKEPLDPEEIIRPPSSSNTSKLSQVFNSAQGNLSLSFINALANCAFGEKDALMTKKGKDWVFKHKEMGMMSATAALGMLMLWDIEASTELDKYMESKEPEVRAGALLALGIMNATVRSEMDPAFGLIQDYLENGSSEPCVKIGGLFGLGLAYAGTGRDDVCDFLLGYLNDPSNTIETQSIAALALGLVFCGCGNSRATEELANFLVQPDPAVLKAPTLRFFSLALGLMFLGTGAECEGVMTAIMMMPEELVAYSSVSVETCAYAGTGNMLMIQKYLGVISDCVRKANEKAEAAEKAKREAENSGNGAAQNPIQQPSFADSPLGARLRGMGILASPQPQPAAPAAAAAAEEPKTPDEVLPAQGVAVLGIALTAMGEDIGDEMVTRALDHVFQYGDPQTRRAVPLALALLSVSNPRITIVDTLIRLCHDSDDEVAGSAIIALGLVSAGTKNSRVAGMLQGLAEYHDKKPVLLFGVRLAQGLLNLGKGTLTLNPIHSDRTLLCLPAVAGLLVLLHSCLNVQKTILGNMHYLLYSLAITVYPRILVTVDDSEEMKVVKTAVRVGQAVDIAGQAGRPKAITGFQTHTTPVVIGYAERAELASDDYDPLSQFLEGIVLMHKTTDDSPAVAAAAAADDTKMS